MRVTVRGRSMVPALRDGQEVSVRLDDLPAPGEIAMYLDPDRVPVLHRVLAVRSGALLLQGDACPRPDPLVAASRILGTVDGVPRRVWLARRRAAAHALREAARTVLGPRVLAWLRRRRAGAG